MQKSKRILASFLALLTVLPLFLFYPASAGNETEEYMKAVWVSTVYNLDYPKKATINDASLKQEADTILDNAVKNGFNAVILQVRPSADSLYPSDFFPWSKYLTGKQGTAPQNGFDPLDYWVSSAHARGLELHAWINPFRITKNKDEEWNSLLPTHPAKENPAYVIKHVDGNYYFNPGVPAVRSLVVDSTAEIISNYDVDGIHLDDYFYPDAKFPDTATFTKYGSGFATINDWRRSNINQLVKELDTVLHKQNPDLAFGISPAGIWANKKNTALGSDTNGNESYYSHFADTRKWVKDGILDYIAPQIYWEIGNKAADYATLTRWWADVVRDTDVKLYIGIPIYRAGSTDPSSPWYGTAAIANQLEFNKSIPEVDGVILFREAFMQSVGGMSQLITSYFKEGNVTQLTGPVAPTNMGLTIGRPSTNMSTTYSKYYITGTSDPKQPLYINGVAMQGRSASGNWGYLASLKTGKNVFTLTQGSKKKTLTLTKGNYNGATSSSGDYGSTSIAAPNTQSKPALVSTSLYPQKNEMGMSGKNITLSATAPIGATVKATINGSTYTLKPATTKKPSGNKIYTTSYKYTYKMPTYTGTARTIGLGRIKYTMSYGGKTTALTSPGALTAVMQNAPVIAEVTAPVSDIYFNSTSSDGSSGELYKGMRDYAVDFTTNYVKLSMGDWIHKSNIKLITQTAPYLPTITTTKYITTQRLDQIVLHLNAPLAAKLDYEGNKLTLTLPSTANALPVELAPDSPFSLVNLTHVNNVATYQFVLKVGERIEGYFLTLDGNNLVLSVRKGATLSTNPEKPLEGITIILDPGHGGKNPGAIGSLGAAYSEKDVNYAVSAKLYNRLSALGAKVTMTRTAAEDPSLANRLALSRRIKPDLFLSIHSNSLADNADLTKVEGLSVFYYNDLSRPLSKSVFDTTKAMLQRPDKGLYEKKFYVLKGTWCPSYIYETGFIPNPKDAEFLSNPASQDALADSLAQATLNYFS